MHGCFRAGNNQVMIEFGKPNCQLLTSRKICSFWNLLWAQFIQGLTLRGIHWPVHLVLLHAGLGPEQHAWGAPGSHCVVWGKWQVREVTDVEGKGATQMWPSEINWVGPETEPLTGLRPRKNLPFEYWNRKWAVPVTLGLKLLQMQCFWHTGDRKLLGFPKPWSQSGCPSESWFLTCTWASIHHSPGVSKHSYPSRWMYADVSDLLSHEKKSLNCSFSFWSTLDLVYWDFIWLTNTKVFFWGFSYFYFF